MMCVADQIGTWTEEVTRPLLLGYIRRELMPDDEQVAQIELRMSLFAHTGGFSMGFTYIEEPGGWPTAFEDLTASAIRHRIAGVVLPNILHFAVLGVSDGIKDVFERATDTRVLLLESP